MSSKRILVFFIGLICLAFLAVSCRVGGQRRILYIGIDGLDWELVDTLRGQGLLPNFDRLIKGACSAKIETNEWGKGSALYWTDVATGQFSSKHGINGFVIIEPQTQKMIPNTSNRRRTKAFWNILSEKDISVGIVGWYITWPVEAVKGFMVSSYLGVRGPGLQPIWKGSFYSDVPQMVYPPSLEDETKKASLEGEKKYRQSSEKIIPQSKFTKVPPVVTQTDWAFMTDAIYSEIGIRLYRSQKPRVFAIYLSGVDVVGHRFTGKKSKKRLAVIAVAGDVQRNYYLAMDEMIKPFLDAAGADTTIIISSDHGLMRGEHTKNGVFIISGQGIKRGVRLEKPVALVDICPTLLYLVGLPVAEDMDGRVCLEAMTPKFVAAHRIQTIASYGPRKDSSDKPIETHFDQAIIKRLKSLGYLK